MQLSTVWKCSVLPWKRGDCFALYCCWSTCTCQRYESVQCYHGNAAIVSLCIVVDLHALVNGMKVFGVTMETRRLFSFAELSSFETFPTAVKIQNHVKCPILTKFGVPRQNFCRRPPVRNSSENRPVGAVLIHWDGRTYVHGDVTKLTGAFHDKCERAWKKVETLNDISQTLSLFLWSFIAHSVYTRCTKINYKIVPETNFNKYLHYGTSGSE